VPLSNAVLKLKAPFAVSVKSSPPLFCNTTEPFNPLTMPPTVYVIGTDELLLLLDTELALEELDELELLDILDEEDELDELATLETLDEVIAGGAEPPPPPPHAASISAQTIGASDSDRMV
jgi:hypothetical protein